MTTPAEVFEAARQTAGPNGELLSFAKLHLAVYDRLGAFAPTEETIRTYHKANGPKKYDLTVLMAIADVYGLKLSDLGVPAPEGFSDLVFRASRWNAGLAA